MNFQELFNKDLMFITSDTLQFNDTILESNLSEYVQSPLIKNPFLMIAIGAIVTIISGVSFAKLMQIKLRGWEQEKIPTRPLANPKTIASWTGSFMGLTLFFTGGLQVFDFSAKNSLIASLIVALFSGITMWRLINNLLLEVDTGTIKEFDDYF